MYYIVLVVNKPAPTSCNNVIIVKITIIFELKINDMVIYISEVFLQKKNFDLKLIIRYTDNK